MDRMVCWLVSSEQRMLHWANRRPVHQGMNLWLSRWLGLITHTGGATFTLVSALLCALLAPGPWRTAGWQCAVGVAVSHIPVAVVKRKLSRLRPYQALPYLNTCRKPLHDSSFPSGHTTAIFAWLMPLLLADAALLPLLLPIALVLGHFGCMVADVSRTPLSFRCRSRLGAWFTYISTCVCCLVFHLSHALRFTVSRYRCLADHNLYTMNVIALLNKFGFILREHQIITQSLFVQ